jgi:hypothetical protein
MPHFTLTVTPDGLALAVMVGLTGQATSDLLSMGQPLPRPVLLQGIIDTASDLTVVSASVLSQLNLAPRAQHKTRSVAGSHPVRLFEVSLSIPPAGTLRASLLVLDQLLVMEWVSPPPNIAVLVGLDVLPHLWMFLDGPRKEFTIGD